VTAGADRAGGQGDGNSHGGKSDVASAGTEETKAPPKVDRALLEFLVCPDRKTTLIYDAARQELISPAADLAYPIRDGVPLLTADCARHLTDDDRRRHRIKV